MTDLAHHLADKFGIAEQLAGEGVDTNDWDLWQRVHRRRHHRLQLGQQPAAGRDPAARLARPEHAVPALEAALHHQRRNRPRRRRRHVRAAFYNPMQLPGLAESSACGGYYHHDFVRTPSGWKSGRISSRKVTGSSTPTQHPRSRNHPHDRRRRQRDRRRRSRLLHGPGPVGRPVRLLRRPPR